jgi:tetratricopeptide (TPR) repeat protein
MPEVFHHLRIFLCHSSEDKPDVRKLHGHLRAKGFDPWLDEENLLAGEDWRQKIPEVVRAADIVIVCLSRGSINKRGYVQKEIRYALDVADELPEGTIYIIPLKLEECEIPERLRRWHGVSVFDEKGYARLIETLRHRANKSISLTSSSDLTVHPEYFKPTNTKPEVKIERSLVGIFFLVMGILTLIVCVVGGYASLGKLTPVDITPATLAYDSGKECYKEEDNECAINNFTAVLTADPRNIKAYFYRALSYDRKKEYDAAIKDYTRVIEEYDAAFEAAINKLNKCRGKYEAAPDDSKIREEYYVALEGYESKKYDKQYGEAFCNRGRDYYNTHQDAKSQADRIKCEALDLTKQ